MKLKDVCVLDVACCTRDVTLTEAARIMRQEHAGDLVVVDDRDENREPVGMITDRDIVVEGLARGLDPNTAKVGQIMSKQVVVASASEDVDAAIERMKAHGVRRIPVLDDEERVVGIVTLDDVLRLHAEQAAALLQIVSKEQSRESRARR